ncbi:Phosphate transporter family [Gilliamella apis SCGC AB-598-P17]|nr:Phosphate transporter family [Gilliamella apis SCGC AB-598-P17]
MFNVIKYLLKDSVLIGLFFLFYFSMDITYYVVLENRHSFISNIGKPIVDILLVIAVVVEIIFFLSMLIKLFVVNSTHLLTSFLGLILGLTFSFIWLFILYVYFVQYNGGGWDGLGFLVWAFLPAIGSFISYIILILIRMLYFLYCVLSK